MVLEKLENLERAVNVRENVVNEEHEETAATESTTDEGVVVTFENVREGTDDGLRKRKEGTHHDGTKEQHTEDKFHKETTDIQSKYLTLSLSFFISSYYITEFI